MVEGQPAHGDVVGPDGDGLADRADVGEDVLVREQDALGLPGAARGVLDQRGILLAQARGRQRSAHLGERGRDGDMAQRAHPGAQEARHALGLRKRDQGPRLGVAEDADLALGVLLDAIAAERRIDRHRNATREQDADERVEEGRLRSEHQSDTVAGRHAVLAQPRRNLQGALPERAIGDRLVRLPGEHDMHALGVRHHMPLERLEKRRRRRGGGLGRRQPWAGGHVRFGEPWLRRDHCRGEIARTRGVLHDAVGETHAELLLDAQQQLDALETADPEVAIERVVEPDWPVGPRAAELADKLADDVEHLRLGAAVISHGDSSGSTCRAAIIPARS